MARYANARVADPGAAVSFSRCNGAENNPNAANVKLDERSLRANPRYHRLTERLHWLGPRPIGELLLEVAAGRDLIQALEEYAQLDPGTVARLGARDWPPLPLELVA
jgi:hypothetical protein